MAVIRGTADLTRWRHDGIVFEKVRLEGSYPNTELVMIFRAAESETTPYGKPSADCRFGARRPVWPAEYADPNEEAFFNDVYFMEFIGTDPGAYLKVRGSRPCDPTHINWLEPTRPGPFRPPPRR